MFNDDNFNFLPSRGFEVAKGFEGGDVRLPKRSTRKSAGYDFEALENTVIKANDVTVVKTGIKAFMKSDEVLKLYIRSSVGIKKNIVLANQVGIIDADYYENESNDGHIMIAVRSFREDDIIIQKGERIAQGIFEKYLKTFDDEVETSRTGGVGSTN